MDFDESKKINKLVEVIEVQNFKEYNKNENIYESDNGYDEENNGNIDKETVCCSEGCSIY